MADVLKLGDFVFEIDDMPDGIPLGGEQMIAVRKFPGGNKDVQSFGVQQKNPSWSGVFNYENAIDKVRTLYKMFISGDVYSLQIGSDLNIRYGVIKNFEFTYQSPISIPYSIELEIAPQVSSVTSDVISNSGTSSSTSNSNADSNSPAPQNVYMVSSGDTLWAIAQKYYGDGSQYRKIADANQINDPNSILAGQKLVIPA